MLASPRRDELLRKRLQRFTRKLHGLEKGDVRALHRTRVATRRLREVLPVLQLDGDLADKLNRRLKKVTERLGSVRELDVLMLLIEELHESDRYQPDALNCIAVAVDQERKARRERLIAKAPMAELHRLARKLESVSDALKKTDRSDRSRRPTAARSTRWAVEARVARRAGRLSQAIDDAGAVYLPDRLHVVRVALKKLRYAIEIANEACARSSKAELRALEEAQDLLGRLHDLHVLVDRAREAQVSLTPPHLVTWQSLESLIAVLEDDCRRLHARYVHDRNELTALCTSLARVAVRSRTTARRITA